MSDARGDVNRVKQYGVWISLALTLGATLWISMTEEVSGTDAVIAAPPRAGKAHMAKSAPTVQATELDITRLRRAPLSETPGDLFSTEIPASEKIESAPVAVAEVIPPLPFVYAGKLEDDGSYIVFLTSGDKNYSVRVGDVIDRWQVKSVHPPQMILSYLPLKSEVPLMIGEVN